jgi:RNA methyltransferase, TrmH family
VIKSSRIESQTNRYIKWLKSLGKKKNRWSENLFIIEGIRSVEQVLDNKNEFDLIVYSDSLDKTDKGSEILSRIMSSDHKSIYISDGLFKSISDTEQPQWIMAVVKFELKTFFETLKESENFYLLLDRVQDPGNMGTIIRTAEAFGANGIIITEGCVDIYNSKTVRSSMGAIIDIPIIYYEDIKEAIADIKKHGIKIISSSLHTNSNIYSLDLKGDVAIVIGNEGTGISDYVIDSSDALAKIPMIGKAESLNAAVASGVLMYEVLRQRIE